MMGFDQVEHVFKLPALDDGHHDLNGPGGAAPLDTGDAELGGAQVLDERLCRPIGDDANDCHA